MAITASGLYLQQFKVMFEGSATFDYDTNACKAALLNNTQTPDFVDTDPNFTTGPEATAQLANGNGYTTGGALLAGKGIAFSGNVLEITATDPTWATSTLTARGSVIWDTVSDDLICLLDFTQDVSTTNGTFTLDLPANGFIRLPSV